MRKKANISRILASRWWLPVLILCAILPGTVSTLSAETRRDAKEKARYFVLEGIRRSSLQQFDAAYECFSRAYSLDPSNEYAAYNIGWINLFLPATGKPYPVLELMQPYLKSNPDDYYAWQTYGAVADNLHNYEESLKAAKRMHEIDPAQMELLYKMAQLESGMGLQDSARIHLDALERAEGVQSTITSGKVNNELSRQKPDTALMFADLDALIHAAPGASESYMLKSSLYARFEMTDSALVYAKKALAVDPQSISPLVFLASIYAESTDTVSFYDTLHTIIRRNDITFNDKFEIINEFQDKISDALSAGRAEPEVLCDSIIALYPERSDSYMIRAALANEKKEYELAEQLLRKAFEISPEGINAASMLLRTVATADSTGSRVCAEYENIALRLPALLPADSVESGESGGLTSSADAYDEPDAMLLNTEPFEEEDASDSNSDPRAIQDQLRALHFIGMAAYASDANVERACEIGDMIAASIAPGMKLGKVMTSAEADSLNLTTYHRNLLSVMEQTLGDAMLLKGDTISGFKAYDRALVLFPENVSTLNNYAYLLADNNEDLDRAYSMINTALKYSPDDPMYLDTLAWVYFRQGLFRMALSTQENALSKIDEPESEYLEHYGDILSKTGEEEKAVENWQKALDKLCSEPLSSNELYAEKTKRKIELLKRKIQERAYVE